MRAIVRAQRQAFDRPAFAIGKVFAGKPREEHCDLLPRILMGHIGDLRTHHRWIGNHIVGDGDRQVNKLRHCGNALSP